MMFSVALVLILSAQVLAIDDAFICEDCINRVDSMVNSLTEQSLVEKVAGVIEEKVCAASTVWVEENCQDQVKVFLPQFMSFLQVNFPKGLLCSKLDKCPLVGTPEEVHLTTAAIDLQLFTFTHTPSVSAGPAPAPAPAPKPTPQPGPQPGPQPTPGPTPNSYQYCDYCQLVVGELRTLIEQDDAKKLVLQYVDEICNQLPYDKDQCLNLVEMYIDQVFQLLETYLDPFTLCSILEYCQSMFVGEAQIAA
eukprot:TRINITY_DN5432_c0_g1_i1.p1 TRINITY_DN5432_c0_g1~~TRINITY_DN5432_c0_g1_i1.p1  ORF type:complete len:250 (-),score=34.51 TRINITY_DN5432_c0_g1_i1:798-1547(-)